MKEIDFGEPNCKNWEGDLNHLMRKHSSLFGGHRSLYEKAKWVPWEEIQWIKDGIYATKLSKKTSFVRNNPDWIYWRSREIEQIRYALWANWKACVIEY
jgi:hypothetical protein